MPDPDQHIIEDIRAGNSRRYALLVDRYKDRAMTLALRLVGAREDAEELVQDGFIRAYRSLDQFRGDAKFSTWFYRILYNVCQTNIHRRREKPELLDVQDEKSLDKILVDHDEISVHERLEEEETQRILASEMEQLPDKFKIPVTLFYVQEMSYEEISAVMNAPLGTVKTNLFRGRNLLRKRVLARLKEEVKVE